MNIGDIEAALRADRITRESLVETNANLHKEVKSLTSTAAQLRTNLRLKDEELSRARIENMKLVTEALSPHNCNADAQVQANMNAVITERDTLVRERDAVSRKLRATEAMRDQLLREKSEAHDWREKYEKEAEFAHKAATAADLAEAENARLKQDVSQLKASLNELYRTARRSLNDSFLSTALLKPTYVQDGDVVFFQTDPGSPVDESDDFASSPKDSEAAVAAMSNRIGKSAFFGAVGSMLDREDAAMQASFDAAFGEMPPPAGFSYGANDVAKRTEGFATDAKSQPDNTPEEARAQAYRLLKDAAESMNDMNSVREYVEQAQALLTLADATEE